MDQNSVALAARSSPLLLVVGVWCWWVVAGRLGAEWLVADDLENWKQLKNRMIGGADGSSRLGTAGGLEPGELTGAGGLGHVELS